MQPSGRGAGRLLCGTLAWLPEPVGVQGQQVGWSAKVIRSSVPQVCKVSADALPIVESAVLEASDVVAVDQICSRYRQAQVWSFLMQVDADDSLPFQARRETSYRLKVGPFVSKVWYARPLAHEVESSSCSTGPRISKILNVGFSFLLRL